MDLSEYTAEKIYKAATSVACGELHQSCFMRCVSKFFRDPVVNF